MDKYKLLLLLKEFYCEDEECSNSCIDCNMKKECEQLSSLLEKLFNLKNTLNPF